MSVAKAENRVMSMAAQSGSFFRQSSWLMFANVVGGFFMWAVHPLGKSIGPAEYGIFIAFLSLAMAIPAGPLQVVLAHQTAQALAQHRERQLAGIIRWVWLGTALVWAVLVLVGVGLRSTIIQRWQLSDPAALWMTFPVLLLTFWLPMLSGVLQGRQDFLGLGWCGILNGAGRFGVAAFGVMVLGGYATAMMTGVLLGLGIAVAMAAWLSRGLWLGPSEPFDWRNLLGQAVPLVFGAAAFQFLFTADAIFVKAYFASDQVGFYGAAGTLARALMWLVGPLVGVMFPRIVHSAARAERTSLVGLVLLGTLLITISGTVCLSLMGPWLIKLIYKPAWVKVASSVLPWYAAAMVPLASANVLMNNLLARSSFRIVVPMCLLAAAYGFGLTRFHDSLKMVLQTMGLCNLLLLVLCIWFTWGPSQQRPPAELVS